MLKNEHLNFLPKIKFRHLYKRRSPKGRFQFKKTFSEIVHFDNISMVLELRRSFVKLKSVIHAIHVIQIDQT